MGTRGETGQNFQAKLAVSLKLDHQVYFPLELGDLTITVQNPTSEDLLVLEPFVRQTGYVWLLQKDGPVARAYGVDYAPLTTPSYVEIVGGAATRAKDPTIVIHGGEQLVKTIPFYEKGLWEGSEAGLSRFGGGAPVEAGDYRLTYWSGRADFQVALPYFEGVVQIDLPDVETVQEEGHPPVQVKLRTYAFILANDGKHYLCLEKVPSPRELAHPRTDKDGRLRALDFPFWRYSRIAESDEPFLELNGESNAAGDITLRWGKEGEKHLTLTRAEWQNTGLKFGQ